MMLSELIGKLQTLQKEHGDMRAAFQDGEWDVMGLKRVELLMNRSGEHIALLTGFLEDDEHLGSASKQPYTVARRY